MGQVTFLAGSVTGSRQMLARATIQTAHLAAPEKQSDGSWLSRKGAIDASEGIKGVIPGSMGALSHIVSGKGNPDSYNSSAHGAGRMYSRTRARKEFTTDSLSSMMEGKAWNKDNAKALLDEHPDAYKPIEQVMEDQQDLVRPTHLLRQIVNYKGA